MIALITTKLKDHNTVTSSTAYINPAIHTGMGKWCFAIAVLYNIALTP